MMPCFHIPLIITITLFGGNQEPKSNNLDAVLWVKTSGEYAISMRQVYLSAREKLDGALADPQWTAALEQTKPYAQLPPAIVFDVDETLLSNMPFQERFIKKGGPFSPAMWDTWVSEAQAEALPGALAFVRYAQERGVTILYITNRTCEPRQGSEEPCPQKQDTLANLKKRGFPVTPERLALKKEKPDWGSEKTSRRAHFAKNYRIVMFMGDDMGDFVSGAKGQGVTPKMRRDLAEKHKDYWGNKWFLLPNPMYGSWDRAIADKWEALD